MKTTKEDFIYFKKQCEKWAKRLGLSEYELGFYHVTHEEMPMGDKGAISSVGVHNNGKIAYVYLCKDWDAVKTTKAELCSTALHEVIHILLFQLWEYASNRFGGSKELYETEEHVVINRLIKVLKEKR